MFIIITSYNLKIIIHEVSKREGGVPYHPSMQNLYCAYPVYNFFYYYFYNLGNEIGFELTDFTVPEDVGFVAVNARLTNIDRVQSEDDTLAVMIMGSASTFGGTAIGKIPYIDTSHSLYTATYSVMKSSYMLSF